MEREKKSGFGSSWADEVEREEEEESQKQRIEIEAKTNCRKPNPFGAARPREVVLQEKGVDWRKLDQNLDHNHSNHRKDKNLKENISTPQIIRHDDQFPLRSICPPEQTKPHPQNSSPLVPPLRYAPKNIMALMEQIRRGRKDISNAAMESSCIARMRAYHIISKDPIILREDYSDSHCKRNCPGERSFVADQDRHANGRRRVLLNLKMERANFSKYCNVGDNYGTERRMSFAYGNQNSERTYDDYCICDIERGNSNGRGLRSAGYGHRERTNPSDMRNEGVDLRDATRMKRRLSAIHPGPCNQKRNRNQARK